jgi:UDP-glucuronate 4-epimerase
MKILVTGAAGFIGSHTSELLIARGHSVVGIDNFDPFYPRHFKLHNIQDLLDQEGFEFQEGDILDKSFLENIFQTYSINTVIHLAAKAGVRPSIDHIEDYYQTNVTGTLNILEAMKSAGIKNMLFASSSSIYGNNEKIPFSESDHVDNPISPYASTKKSGELLCHVFSHLHKFNITCLRFFTVFGPRQRPDLAIHKFTRLIEKDEPIPVFGDGSTARDYTFVNDITEGISCALNKMGGYQVYNLGESRTITLIKLIEVIESKLGKKAILDYKAMQPGDVQITYADIQKSKSQIGYNPKYSLESGIESFVAWYLQNKKILYPESKMKAEGNSAR